MQEQQKYITQFSTSYHNTHAVIEPCKFYVTLILYPSADLFYNLAILDSCSVATACHMQLVKKINGNFLQYAVGNWTTAQYG